MKNLTDASKHQKLYEKKVNPQSRCSMHFFAHHLSCTFGTKANNDEKNPFYPPDFCRIYVGLEWFRKFRWFRGVSSSLLHAIFVQNHFALGYTGFLKMTT